MREQLSTMLKTAMKAGDKRRVATVRLIQAALKDKDIELRPSGKTITDEDIAAVLRKMVKQRQDSIGIYDGAGRTDLADAEREDMGKVIAAMKAKHAGRIDFGKVSSLVKTTLAGA